jgi:hypothetical protein
VSRIEGFVLELEAGFIAAARVAMPVAVRRSVLGDRDETEAESDG